MDRRTFIGAALALPVAAAVPANAVTMMSYTQRACGESLIVAYAKNGMRFEWQGIYNGNPRSMMYSAFGKPLIDLIAELTRKQASSCGKLTLKRNRYSIDC